VKGRGDEDAGDEDAGKEGEMMSWMTREEGADE
jgi:hypothetical protein